MIDETERATNAMRIALPVALFWAAMALAGGCSWIGAAALFVGLFVVISVFLYRLLKVVQ